MSILIKGMDMPKDCDDCMFNFYREVDSCPTCYLTKHIVIRKKEENIPTDCPLVEIPDSVIEIGAKFILLGDKVNRIIEAEGR